MQYFLKISSQGSDRHPPHFPTSVTFQGDTVSSSASSHAGVVGGPTGPRSMSPVSRGLLTVVAHLSRQEEKDHGAMGEGQGEEKRRWGCGLVSEVLATPV